MSEANRCPKCSKPLPPGSPRGLCPACLLQRGLEANTVGYTDEARARWTPPAIEQLAPLFPELDILELIGRGGMGAVYKARQKELDRLVALKILPPEIGRDAGFAQRFAREAQAMAKLGHPHIVTIHDFGQREALYFFIMEYIDGLSLRQLLDRGAVSPKEALAIVPQICDALQYAHDRGIVHRDIKPENILLNRQGQVKIADFGLAKLIGPPILKPAPEPAAGAAGDLRPPQATAATERVLGTPQYMAPEQIDHPGEVDHRADIYSLGVVFYQMLTGELPCGKFEPPSRKVLIDVRLDEVVLKALEKEPERRYQQVSEVKTEVETIVATGGSTGKTSPRQEGAVNVVAPGDEQVNHSRQAVKLPAIIVLFIRVIYVIAVLAAMWPFFGLGMDPDDRGHLWRFIFCPLIAAGIAFVGGFIALISELIVKRIHDGNPPRGRRIVPLSPAKVAVIVAFLMGGAYLAGLAINRIWREPSTGETLATAIPHQVSQPVPELAKGNPWRITFPSGVTVELVGVSEYPSEGKPWWRPDGSPLPQVPYARFIGDIYFKKGQMGREFAIRTENLPRDRASIKWAIDIQPSSEWGGYVTILEDDRSAAAILPEALNHATVKVGVAAGPWKTIGDFDGSEKKEFSVDGLTFSVSKIAEEHKGDRVTRVSASTITIAEDPKGVRVKVDWNTPDQEKLEVRVRAIDKTGKQITGMEFGGAAADRNKIIMRSQTVVFDGVALQDIKQFDFQARPYEWVAFPHVSLRPKSLSAAEPAPEETSALAAREASGWKEVLIPDTDTKGVPVILDLASGEMLAPPDGKENEPFSYFTRLGQGDVGFDRMIFLLRGGKLLSVDGKPLAPKEVKADATAYDLMPLSGEVVVKTGDGRTFRLELLGVDSEGGLRIRYAPMAAPAVTAAQIDWIQTACRRAEEFLASLRQGKPAEAYAHTTQEYRRGHEGGLERLAERMDLAKAKPVQVYVATEAACVVVSPVSPVLGRDTKLGLGMIRVGEDYLIRDIDLLPDDEAVKRFVAGFRSAYPAATGSYRPGPEPEPPSSSDRSPPAEANPSSER